MTYIEKLWFIFNTGLDWDEIADKLYVNRSTIGNWIYGETPRRKPLRQSRALIDKLFAERSKL